jgi:two-component system nitrogen regulation response regulator NtrX
VTVLRLYPWPGNVRELRNIIERLVIMVPGDVISAADLSFLDGADRRAIADASQIVPLYQARDAWEREYLLATISAVEGNISRAADALGIERSNFYRKMRSLGIGPGQREDEDGT